MGQSVRQTARRQALEAQARRRRERVAAERRRSALGVDVVVALSERDAAVGRHERAAGVALSRLTGQEGLSLAEACEWADDLPQAEARRLRRLVDDDSVHEPIPESGTNERGAATAASVGDGARAG